MVDGRVLEGKKNLELHLDTSQLVGTLLLNVIFWRVHKNEIYYVVERLWVYSSECRNIIFYRKFGHGAKILAQNFGK